MEQPPPLSSQILPFILLCRTEIRRQRPYLYNNYFQEQVSE